MTRKRKADVQRRRSFKKARQRALARLWIGLDLQWTPERDRDRLHEREPSGPRNPHRDGRVRQASSRLASLGEI